MTLKARFGIALLSAVTGCASVSDRSSEQGCQFPTLQSGVVAMTMAGIGHGLDQKTGGGRGAEIFMGKATDSLVRRCPASGHSPEIK